MGGVYKVINWEAVKKELHTVLEKQQNEDNIK